MSTTSPIDRLNKCISDLESLLSTMIIPAKTTLAEISDDQANGVMRVSFGKGRLRVLLHGQNEPVNICEQPLRIRVLVVQHAQKVIDGASAENVKFTKHIEDACESFERLACLKSGGVS